MINRICPEDIAKLLNRKWHFITNFQGSKRGYSYLAAAEMCYPDGKEMVVISDSAFTQNGADLENYQSLWGTSGVDVTKILNTAEVIRKSNMTDYITKDDFSLK